MESLPKISAILITRDKKYPKIDIDFPFDEVIIETECPYVRRRFELAGQARNDIIYVQDDDCEINVKELWKHYDGPTCAITQHHRDYYRDTGVTLIGFGAFFPKKAMDFSRWEESFGEVPKQEADRVFTYLTPFNEIVMPIKMIDRPVKMSDEPEHYNDLKKLIAKLHEI